MSIANLISRTIKLSIAIIVNPLAQLALYKYLFKNIGILGNKGCLLYFNAEIDVEE